MAAKTGELQDADLGAKMESHARDVKRVQKEANSQLFKLGYELYLARATCHGGGGSERFFGAWLESIGISRSGAYRAIRRWEAFGPKICPNVGQNAPKWGEFLCFSQCEISALDELSKPSTPAKALKDGVKIAQSGKPMTRKEVKALIQQHGGPKKEEKVDLGQCPVCAGKRWKKADEGHVCAKCSHVHGEPAGDLDEDRLASQRRLTEKTVGALMRAFNDLNRIHSRPEHKKAIELCDELLLTARGWKA